MNILENIIYYSIFCPKYENYLNDFDLLPKIRQNFFETERKQKNKITKKYLGEVYHYSYDLEKSKPMKWKKMLADKVIEKSYVNNDRTYKIVYYNDNKIKKAIYFDNNHNINQVDYFSNKENHKKILTLQIKNSKLLVIEYDDKKEANTYEVYPMEIDLKRYDLEAFDYKLTTCLCMTNKGNLSYCTKEQIDELKKLENNKKNNKASVNAMNNENVNTDSCNMKSSSQNAVCSHKLKCQKIIKTENGEKFYYFGEMKSDLRDGRGITTTENGITAYDGDYVNDKKDGFGVFYYRSGAVGHVGYFKCDKKHNLGITFNKEHDKVVIRSFDNGQAKNMVSEFDKKGNLLYAGRIENGEKNGAAVSYKAADNKILISKFKNGLKTGKGTIFDENGELLYNGEVADAKANGMGIKYKKDGTVKYKGSFLNDKYSGHGKLYMDNGYIIEGNFENGFANGIATKYDSDLKKIYEGNFKDGIYFGEGTLYFGDGHSLKGTFTDGAAKGIVSEFDKNGEVIYIGNFEKGKYEGKGSFYKNGKKVYEGYFKNGEYNGLGCLYKNEECVYWGEFKNNKKCGFGTEYCLGSILYTGYYKDNLYNGLGISFESGLPIYVGLFNSGKKHGRINEIYKNKVVKECIYENDELIYVKEYEYPSMNLLYYGNVKDNKKTGMGCTFTAYAEKDKEGIFAEDEIINRMDVFFKELPPLPECSRLNDAGYDDFRFGPEFAVEKKLSYGVYSGPMHDGKPQGRGTILYDDHRYTGHFKNGQPFDSGIIYKNDGEKINGQFLINPTDASEHIEFSKGISYDLIKIK